MAIVSKDNPYNGSIVRQCIAELFVGDEIKERKIRFHMAKWINPDRGEIFFAQRVIFVEGETERVVIPHLAQRLGIFNPNISIIDCGSKHNLPFYITIAKEFEIPYVVIHDEDPISNPIPDGWSADKKREKERTFHLNSEISQLVESPLGHVEQFSPDFEGASGISKNQGKKKGKALAALEHFEKLSVCELPEVLESVIRASFTTSGASSVR